MLGDFGGKGAFGGLFGDPDKAGEDQPTTTATTTTTTATRPAPMPSGGADALTSGTGKSGKAIYLHWTAGGYNSVVGPYHTIFTGDGKMHQNVPYTQHTQDILTIETQIQWVYPLLRWQRVVVNINGPQICSWTPWQRKQRELQRDGDGQKVILTLKKL